MNSKRNTTISTEPNYPLLPLSSLSYCTYLSTSTFTSSQEKLRKQILRQEKRNQ